VKATRGRIGLVVWWALVAIGLIAALASLLSFGLFLFPLVVAAVVVLATRPGRARGAAIALIGAGVGPLLLAWLNRDGPGRVCRDFPPDGIACAQELNPWPYAAAGAGCLGVALILFRSARTGNRRRRTQRPDAM
jgi:hypothetical protein